MGIDKESGNIFYICFYICGSVLLHLMGPEAHCGLTIYRLLLLSSQQFSRTIWGNGLHKNFENRFSQTIWEKWISQTNWDNGFYKQFENTVFKNNFRKRIFFLQIILENIFHKQFMKTVYTISSLKRFSQAIWENGFNEQF